MDTLTKLKSKRRLTRTDIAELLASIGEPGLKQDEKINAVKQLNQTNVQGIDLSESLMSYAEY